MVPKGYGKTNLLISDAEINKMATEEEREAAHQLNRRTEFSVLSFDFVPKPEIPEVPEMEEGSDDSGTEDTGTEEETKDEE